MPKFICLICIDDNFNQTILKIYFEVVKKTLKKRIVTIYSICIFLISTELRCFLLKKYLGSIIIKLASQPLRILSIFLTDIPAK